MMIKTGECYSGFESEFFTWMVRIVTSVCGTIVGHLELTIVNMKFCINDVVNFLLFIIS